MVIFGAKRRVFLDWFACEGTIPHTDQKYAGGQAIKDRYLKESSLRMHETLHTEVQPAYLTVEWVEFQFEMATELKCALLFVHQTVILSTVGLICKSMYMGKDSRFCLQ